MDELAKYSTKDLIYELLGRDGVTSKIAEPYNTINVTDIEGPAIVLVVTD